MSDNKTFVVIGGSTGIGQEIAQKLSVENNVIATYNSTVMESTGNITYFHYDVTQLDSSLDWLPDEIHGIVYCVGAIQLKPFHRVKLDDFNSDFQKQTLGAIRVLQNAMPALKSCGSASVILFSTVAVQMGFPFHSIVSTSKGSIEGLTKALAAEWAPSIRVNAIAPSITLTPLAANLLNTPEKIEANAQRHPLKRIGNSTDIAELAAFLLSDKAAWITGQIHHIDGGISSLKV